MSSGRRVVLLLLAALVLVGGVALAISAGDDEPPPEPPPAEQATPDDAETGPEPERSEEPPPRVETIRMRGRAPVGEPRTLRYRHGDVIRLRFVSDAEDEIHVHGFDRYVDVPAGGTATDRFRATIEGIFEVESHASGELLAQLEIRPR